MGDGVAKKRGIELKRLDLGTSSAFAFRSVFGMTFPEGRGFAGVCGGEIDLDNCRLKGSSKDNIFFLGACMSDRGAIRLASLIDKTFFESAYAEALQFASSMIPNVTVASGDRAIDEMMNFFVPYQISACRFYARGSF
jgi:hypothetical protein